MRDNTVDLLAGNIKSVINYDEFANGLKNSIRGTIEKEINGK